MPDLALNTTDWLVVGAGLLTIVWLNYYFFANTKPSGLAAASNDGVQEITVIVEGGYTPSTVKAKVGQKLRIVFDRRETSSCSEEVTIPDFSVRKFLPAHEKTNVEITPATAGVHEFACGMGMLHGKIIVTDQSGEAK